MIYNYTSFLDFESGHLKDAGRKPKNFNKTPKFQKRWMEHDLNIKLYVNIITVKSNGFVSTELVQVIIIIFIRQIGVK